MNRVLACCLLAVVGNTGAIANPYYGDYPSYHELAKLEEAIHREFHCIFFFFGVDVSSLSHVGFFHGEFGSLVFTNLEESINSP